MLNPYVTRMASQYYDIGLELDVINSRLRIIRDDPNFPGLVNKCQEMLTLWLEGDTSATWEKLCRALERRDQNVLARDIREEICSM